MTRKYTERSRFFRTFPPETPDFLNIAYKIHECFIKHSCFQVLQGTEITGLLGIFIFSRGENENLYI